MALNFKLQNAQNVSDIFNYNVESFGGDPDFPWTHENIQGQTKQGWEFYTAEVGDEVVAAVLIKKESNSLQTRHTNVKMAHRGQGYSHELKMFIEELAKKSKVDSVKNFCRKDNFRGISLNETHGYTKSSDAQSDTPEYEEWIKTL